MALPDADADSTLRFGLCSQSVRCELAGSAEISPRVERDEKTPLKVAVEPEVAGRREQLTLGFHRPGPNLREHRVAIDVCVFDDQDGSGGDERRVSVELAEDVVLRVIAVEDHHDRLGFVGARADSVDDPRVCGRAVEVLNPRMRWAGLVGLDVNGDDAPVDERVHHGRVEERSPP
jgi:hypothetical protein